MTSVIHRSDIKIKACCTKKFPRPFVTRFCAYRLRYQVSIYKTNGPLVFIYGCGGHLSHVAKIPCTNFCSPYPLKLHNKFGFDWLSSFGKGDV